MRLSHLTSVACAAIFLASCTQDIPTGLKSAESRRGPPRSARAAGEKIPGRYIVRLRDDVSDIVPTAIAIASAHGGTVRRIYTHAIKGFSAQIPDAAAAALARHPQVRYVEQDQRVRAITEQADATWGIDRIDQVDLPLSTTYVYNATGDGVDAYIIDTGVRLTHSEFGGRAVSGVDQVDFDNHADDCHGHGTHVAGTVGGTTYGVAKDVRLIAVRVLDCDGWGTWEGVIAGIDWVTADHQAGQPAVANMSLGGGYNQAANDAVTSSVADGIVYAVAAGNGYGDACWNSPASTPAALTVGATDISDTEAEFSDRGSCVDIWAPGVDVTSAWNFDDNATATISGTSMAAPHVAGASALYLQTNQTATAADVDDELSANATIGKITWNDPWGSKPAPPPAGQDYLLYTGFINAGPLPPPPVAPSGLTANAASYSEVDLAWNDNSDNESSFKIERCKDEGGGAPCTDFAQVAQAGRNSTSYRDVGLTGNSTYRYRVRASNAGRRSDYSNVADATTPPPPPPPAAPSGLQATAVSTSRIDLTWNDNSSDEHYFEIERCQDVGGPCTDFSFIAWTYADETSYQDWGVSSSTTYRYRVRAAGIGGYSDYSNVTDATTPAPPPPPTAPSDLVAAAASTSQINLAWADNSGDEDGFRIERCVGAGCTSFGQIAQVGAGVTSFNNTGLSSSTTYRYRVRAFSVNGNSGYSNDAAATTFNQPPIASYNWSCKNGACTFDGTISWDPDGSIVSYSWSFGDGTTGSGATTSHTFKQRGVYNVTLTVTDNGAGAGSRTCEVAATNGRARSGTC